jgi:hypothetical protein
MLSERKKFFTIGIISLLIAYLYSTDIRVGFFVRSLLQFFCTGVSAWKGTLFFVFLSTCCLLRIVLSDKKFHIGNRNIVFSLLIAHIGGIILHFHYSYSYALDPFVRTIAVSGDHQSSNFINHLHVMKAEIAMLFSLLGISDGISMRGDYGKPFKLLLDNKITFLCLLLSCYAVAVVSLSCARPVKLQDRFRHYQFFCWLAYVIASFMCLKSLFDGGLFSSENITGMIFIFLILYFQSFLLTIVPLILSIGTFGVALELTGNQSLIVFALRDIIRGLCFLSLFLLIADCLLKQKRFVAFCFTLSITIFLARNFFWRHEFQSVIRPYKTNDSIYLTIKNAKKSVGTEVARSNHTAVYLFKPATSGKLLDIYQMLSIPTGYYIYNIDGQTCSRQSPYFVSGEIKVIEGELNVSIPNNALMKEFQSKACMENENCTFRYTGLMKGCTSNDFSSSEIAFLTSQNLKSFIFISSGTL